MVKKREGERERDRDRKRGRERQEKYFLISEELTYDQLHLERARDAVAHAQRGNRHGPRRRRRIISIIMHVRRRPGTGAFRVALIWRHSGAVLAIFSGGASLAPFWRCSGAARIVCVL